MKAHIDVLVETLPFIGAILPSQYRITGSAPSQNDGYVRLVVESDAVWDPDARLLVRMSEDSDRRIFQVIPVPSEPLPWSEWQSDFVGVAG